MAIIKNHRLEYEVGQIDVAYPKNDKETYFGSVPVIVPNNWTPWLGVKKGDLISLEGKQYRVLKKSGSIVEVLAMYDAGDTTFGDSINYPGCTLDTYCDEVFYNNLSADMKNAIVEKNFSQDSWYAGTTLSDTQGNPIYQGKTDQETYTLGLGSMAFGITISRRCYVLSVQDVIDYLEVTASMTSENTTLTNENVWKMFWNQTTSPGLTYPWLRSAEAKEDTNFVYHIFGRFGKIDLIDASGTEAVRPAFQIDLSKIDFKEV